MPRPTLLTPELQDKVVRLLRAGVFRQTACEHLGISDRTMADWCKRGRDEEEGIYAEFLRAVKEAQTEAEIRNTISIMKAGESDWKAALAYNERKFPERWGRRDHKTIDATVRAAPEGGHFLPLEILGELLAPYPEAKAAVGAYLEAKFAEAQKLQLEDRS